MNDALIKMLDRFLAYDPLFISLSKDQKVGFLYAERWGRMSEIPGFYTDAEILARIKDFIDEH